MSKRREALLGASNAPKVETIPIPGLGIDVEIVGLTGREIFAVRAASLDESGERADNAKLFPGLIIAAVRDPDTHQLLFTKGDLEALLEMPFAILEYLANEVGRLCRIDITSAKTEDEILKNSSRATPISGSPSSSPSASAE